MPVIIGELSPVKEQLDGRIQVGFILERIRDAMLPTYPRKENTPPDAGMGVVVKSDDETCPDTQSSDRREKNRARSSRRQPLVCWVHEHGSRGLLTYQEGKQEGFQQ